MSELVFTLMTRLRPQVPAVYGDTLLDVHLPRSHTDLYDELRAQYLLLPGAAESPALAEAVQNVWQRLGPLTQLQLPGAWQVLGLLTQALGPLQDGAAAFPLIPLETNPTLRLQTWLRDSLRRRLVGWLGDEPPLILGEGPSLAQRVTCVDRRHLVIADAALSQAQTVGLSGRLRALERLRYRGHTGTLVLCDLGLGMVDAAVLELLRPLLPLFRHVVCLVSYSDVASQHRWMPPAHYRAFLRPNDHLVLSPGTADTFLWSLEPTAAGVHDLSRLSRYFPGVLLHSWQSRFRSLAREGRLVGQLLQPHPSYTLGSPAEAATSALLSYAAALTLELDLELEPMLALPVRVPYPFAALRYLLQTESHGPAWELLSSTELELPQIRLQRSFDFSWG